MDAAAFRHVPRYSEHMHRATVRHGGQAATSKRTAEQHGACTMGQREAAFLAVGAGDCGTHAGALSVNPRAVSFPASLAGSRLPDVEAANGDDDLGVDGIPITFHPLCS